MLTRGFEPRRNYRTDSWNLPLVAPTIRKWVLPFDERGTFHPLPWIDTHKMAHLFMTKVFSMLIAEEKISEDLAQKVASWPHSGFNIHNGVEIDAA